MKFSEFKKELSEILNINYLTDVVSLIASTNVFFRENLSLGNKSLKKSLGFYIYFQVISLFLLVNIMANFEGEFKSLHSTFIVKIFFPFFAAIPLFYAFRLFKIKATYSTLLSAFLYVHALVTLLVVLLVASFASSILFQFEYWWLSAMALSILLFIWQMRSWVCISTYYKTGFFKGLATFVLFFTMYFVPVKMFEGLYLLFGYHA